MQTRLLPQPPPQPPPHPPGAAELLTCGLPGRCLLASRRAPFARALRLPLPLPLPPGRSLRCRARSESLAESRWRGGGTASQRASGGAAVRSRPSGALALTAHPGARERESRAESTPSLPRLCGRGECKGEKGKRYQTRVSQSVRVFVTITIAWLPSFFSGAYSSTQASQQCQPIRRARGRKLKLKSCEGVLPPRPSAGGGASSQRPNLVWKLGSSLRLTRLNWAEDGKDCTCHVFSCPRRDSCP